MTPPTPEVLDTRLAAAEAELQRQRDRWHDEVVPELHKMQLQLVTVEEQNAQILAKVSAYDGVEKRLSAVEGDIRLVKVLGGLAWAVILTLAGEAVRRLLWNR